MSNGICEGCNHPLARHFTDVEGVVRCLVSNSSRTTSGLIDEPWRQDCDCADRVSGSETRRREETARREVAQRRVIDDLAASVRERVTMSHQERYDAGLLATTDGKPPAHFDSPAPNLELRDSGQHASYWVLSEAERAKGFVRPVRREYLHETCGTVTRMGLALSETYARQPDFYGSTFCVGCHGHYRVGVDGEFVWKDTTEKVGT